MIENPWKQEGMAEWVFYKPRWSAFFDTELASRLKELNVDTIVVAGCNFQNCPSATLFDATERYFRVVLASDAVSGNSAAGLEWCKGIGVAPLSTQVIESRVLASARQLCHIPR
jgi:nicotinamidase-related amidase